MKRSIMHAMEESALFISALALIVTVLLAGFGMLFQWLVSKDTRQQATEIRKDVGDFKSAASSLLGEIRGLTTETRQSQERQMDTMIHAITGQATDATATGTADIEQRIDGIEAALGDQHLSEQVQDELRDLRKTVEALRYQIPTAMRGIRPKLRPIAKIRSVTVDPPQIESGAGAAITVFYESTAPSRHRIGLSFGVTTPKEKMFSIRFDMWQSVSGAGDRVAVRFPDNFDGADSRAKGDYIATAQLWDPSDDAQPLDRVDVPFSVV